MMKIRKWLGRYNEIFKLRDISLLAPGLAYTTVLSLIPLLAVGLSVFHFFGGLNYLYKEIDPLIKNFLSGAGIEVSKTMQSALSRVHSKTLGFFGVLGLLISSLNLFYQMDVAIQRIWEVNRSKSLMKRLLIYWIILVLGPLAISVLLGMIGSISFTDANYRKYIPGALMLWPFFFVGLFCVYKYVPSTFVSARCAFWSALIASTGVVVLQNFYTNLTKSILKANAIYGGLASIPAFLLWILLLWWICLLGVSFSQALQRGWIQLTFKKKS